MKHPIIVLFLCFFRYLARVCSNLPPIDSEERAILRGNGTSLKEIILNVEEEIDHPGDIVMMQV